MRLSIVAIGAFFLLTGATSVLGEESAKTTQKMEELVVTATRTERTVQEVPAAVTVVSKEEFV